MPSSSLAARLDHVAVAVTDLVAARDHWCGTVGAGLVALEPNNGFDVAQVAFAGGGKLELIAPPPEGGGFVSRFLERFGPVIHHVTLKVDDLAGALSIVRAGGFDVVDVQDSSPWWREGFLRPSQAGGIIVQVAWAAEDDSAWAQRLGSESHPPHAHAPMLAGPTLTHPDLDVAQAQWTLLGADVVRGGAQLRCRWPDSPLDVVVRHGPNAGPVALRLHGEVPPAPPDLGSPSLDVR